MDSAHPKGRLFTVAQAAKHLGVSPNTLRRWDKTGILRSTRTPGNQRRYTQEQLTRFLSSEGNSSSKETVQLAPPQGTPDISGILLELVRAYQIVTYPIRTVAAAVQFTRRVTQEVFRTAVVVCKTIRLPHFHLTLPRWRFSLPKPRLTWPKPRLTWPEVHLPRLPRPTIPHVFRLPKLSLPLFPRLTVPKLGLPHPFSTSFAPKPPRGWLYRLPRGEVSKQSLHHPRSPFGHLGGVIRLSAKLVFSSVRKPLTRYKLQLPKLHLPTVSFPNLPQLPTSLFNGKHLIHGFSELFFRLSPPKRAVLFSFLATLVIATTAVAGVRTGLFSTNVILRSESDEGSQILLRQLADQNDMTGKVLGERITRENLIFTINVPSVFNESLRVEGSATFSGQLTAPNVLYALTAGTGISIGGLQTPTITNTGVLSLGGKTGALVLEAGTDITIADLKISDKATLDTVRGRGGCTACVVDADVTDALTISSSGSVAAGALTADSLDFTQMIDSATLDASTAIAFGASTFALTFTNNGTANMVVNLSSTGDFIIQDAGTTYATFSDTGTLTLNDSALLDLSLINTSGTGEGLRVPQATSCASGTAEGQLCWDTDDNLLYVGDASAAVQVGSGDITAVGSMTSGLAFGDTTADDDWLGLGAAAGRIEFDDQTTDEVNILAANVGIGTATPTTTLDVSGNARIYSSTNIRGDLFSSTSTFYDKTWTTTADFNNPAVTNSSGMLSTATNNEIKLSGGSSQTATAPYTTEANYTQEDMAYGVTLTPSATSGNNITLTLGSSKNWNTDTRIKAGCRVVGNSGVATIDTAPAAQTTIQADVTTAFASTAAIASGSWQLYCTTITGGVAKINTAGEEPTGGTITTSGGNTIHTFTSSGTFTAPSGSTVNVLVVGGGGGGGAGSGCCGPGGGGGAGEYISNTSYSTTTGSITVTVGAGGAGVAGPGGTGNATRGNSGSDSVFNTLTAAGGGGGGAGSAVVADKTGRNGGSGGGGGTNGGSAGTAAPNTGSGSNGAAGSGADSGGGGGANAAGSSTGGGAGIANSISGSSVTYAGGGGGALNVSTGGSGGAGGGGAGGTNGAAGTAGTANRGGGGGGGGNSGSGADGAAGGSGIVIISYATGSLVSAPTSTYYTVITGTDQLALTNPSDIDSVARTETLNSQTIYYSVSFDGRSTFKVHDGAASAWRSIVRDNDATGAFDWEYNSNTTYASETWTNCSGGEASENNTATSPAGCLSEAMAVTVNQITGATLAAITDAQWENTGGWTSTVTTMDFAASFRTTASGSIPEVSLITLTYTNNYSSSQQSWTSENLDAGSGNTFLPNRLTTNWTDTGGADNTVRFQVESSTDASTWTTYPSSTTYWGDASGDTSITSGTALDLATTISTAARYWRVKGYLNTGSTLTDTPSIQDLRLQDSKALALSGYGQLVGVGTTTPGASLDIASLAMPSVNDERIAFRSQAATLTLAGSGTGSDLTITNQRFNQFLAPTINGVSGAGTETVTNATTLYVDAAPSGTNVTITNPYALWVDAGAVRMDGTVEIGAPTTANTTALCWDNSGNSLIYDCNGSATDLAEYYGTTDPAIQAGDIVVATGVAQEVEVTDGVGNKIKSSKAWIARSTKPYEAAVIGIISTQPNEIYGDDGLFSPSENPRPVSIAGRVPVWVGTENGTIKVGDFITSSSTVGIGMKATRSGAVVAKAMENFDCTSAKKTGQIGSTCFGKILAMVHLSFVADPQNTLANLRLDDDGSLIVPRIKASNLFIDQSIATTGLIAKDGSTISNEKEASNSAALSLETGSFFSLFSKFSSLDSEVKKLKSSKQDKPASSSADLAEYYGTADESIEAGDVVVAGGGSGEKPLVAKATHPYQRTLLGVVSTQPTTPILGDTFQKEDNPRPIALSGRVPVKVSGENGAIEIGDSLTSSSTPGVAMAACAPEELRRAKKGTCKPGQVVGKALASYNGEGVGSIVVFVSVGFADPGSFLASLVIGEDGLLKTQEPFDDRHLKLEVGSLQREGRGWSEASPSSSLQPQESSFQSPASTLKFKDLLSRLFSLEEKVASLSALFSPHLRGVHSARLDSAKRATSEVLLGDSSEVNASSSALLTTDSSILGLTSESATVSGTLTVLGRTLLSDVGITGTLSSGLLRIDGLGGAIDTFSGDLKLQGLALGGVDILAGKVTVDKEGNLTVNATVTAKKYAVITEDTQDASAGTVEIPPGKTTVAVTTTALTPTSLIFATPDTTPLPVATRKLDLTTFEIRIAAPTPEPIKVQWWVVN